MCRVENIQIVMHAGRSILIDPALEQALHTSLQAHRYTVFTGQCVQMHI